jgi:tRNA threonylcarbamoyladenosine biosynthesis protein TsaE
MEIQSHNLEETKEAVKAFVQTLSPLPDRAQIVELIGDLGAGKTTFTQILARELGISETVISPTFIIQKRYPIPNHPHFKTLIHMDVYRFENPDEVKTLGLQEDIQNNENLILIEWPSKIQSHIPQSLQIHFEHLTETSRNISW